MTRTLALLALLGTAACSIGTGERPGWQQAASYVTGESPGTSARFAAIATTPRPLLQVGLIDAGTAGTMLLEARNGAYEHYLSPDESSLILNRGMLHNMLGFGAGLMATEASGPLALIMRGQTGTADRIHTYLGGDDRTYFRTYRCTIRPAGTEPVTLVNRTVTASKMYESCRNADDAFDNIYWVDQSRGEIVQSRQWAGPNLGAVSTRRAGLSG